MKVVFLFMSHSSAAPNSYKDWEPNNPCGKIYHDRFTGEIYFEMLSKMVENGVIDDLKIIFESNILPGKAKWLEGKNIHCEVMPEIRFAEKYIEKDTIIFVRGGFKHWLNWLKEKYKGKNWLVLYSANTGRQKWPFWDIILDDIDMNNNVDNHERYYFPFIKPANEKQFYPEKSEVIYDLCIGASHIHDKKGQWRVAKIAKVYNQLFGKNLKMVLPGSPRRSLETEKMYKDQYFIKNCDIKGYVTKKELNTIFNQSKYFIHLGTHGQNDRGVIEAFSSGTPLIIGSPSYHSCLLRNIASIPKNIYDYEKIAKGIEKLLSSWHPCLKTYFYYWYKELIGFEKAVNRLSSLFIEIDKKEVNLTNKENLVYFFEQLKHINFL